MDKEQTPTKPQLDGSKSFQNLMEGKVEAFVKNEAEEVINICELFRDLYQKIYTLTAEVNKKANKE
tara:strand:- start:257 stop:454 length:198 start_codon:yes stop_codon:yes gene_type:complete